MVLNVSKWQLKDALTQLQSIFIIYFLFLVSLSLDEEAKNVCKASETQIETFTKEER